MCRMYTQPVNSVLAWNRTYRARYSFSPGVKKSSVLDNGDHIVSKSYTQLVCIWKLSISFTISLSLSFSLSLSLSHTHTHTHKQQYKLSMMDLYIRDIEGLSDSPLEHYDTLGWAKSLTDWLNVWISVHPLGWQQIVAVVVLSLWETVTGLWLQLTIKALKLKVVGH